MLVLFFPATLNCHKSGLSDRNGIRLFFRQSLCSFLVISAASSPRISVKFHTAWNSNSVKIMQKMSGTSHEELHVLLLPEKLNLHKSAFFELYFFRPLGKQRGCKRKRSPATLRFRHTGYLLTSDTGWRIKPDGRVALSKEHPCYNHVEPNRLHTSIPAPIILYLCVASFSNDMW